MNMLLRGLEPESVAEMALAALGKIGIKGREIPAEDPHVIRLALEPWGVFDIRVIENGWRLNTLLTTGRGMMLASADFKRVGDRESDSVQGW
jgi:hypothetical protein